MSQQIFEPFAQTAMKVCRTPLCRSRIRFIFFPKCAGLQLTISELYLNGFWENLIWSLRRK